MARTFPEEIILLQIDEHGELLSQSASTMNYVMAGAALMDLAFLNRIDTDLKRFMTLDLAPTGKRVLDEVLVQIGTMELLDKDTKFVIEELVDSGAAARVKQHALDALVADGVLRHEESRFFWMRATLYPVADTGPERYTKLHLTTALFSDGPPSPRAAALVGLVDACALFPRIFSKREMEQIRPQIDRLKTLDLIGREISNLINELRSVMFAYAIQVPHH